MVPVRPPQTVLAHGFNDAGALPLSIQALLVLAGVILAAASLLPPRKREVLPAWAEILAPATTIALRVAACLAVFFISVAAAFGPADVALNPAPRMLFTVAWAGLLLLSAVVGPWWWHAGPLALAADKEATASLSATTGIWPAVAGLSLFGIAEQVFEPSSVVVLVTLAAYALVGVAGALRFGAPWLGAADPLHVASGIVGSMSPIARAQRGLRVRSSRGGAGAHPGLSGLAAFLGVLIGINLFDAAEPAAAGLGRLLIFVAFAAVAGAVCAGAARPDWLAPALIPAAVGHLGAHYLAPLLIDTQIAFVLASDPLHRGWNLLGLTGAEIVAEPIAPSVGLWLQLVLLVLGHAVAIVVAADLTRARLARKRASATLFPVRLAIAASLLAGIYLRFGPPA